MAYIRTTKRENPFVQIDKYFLEDSNLSWEAKGILAYILSRPNDWKINHKDLVKKSNGGKAKVESALLELLANGYCNWYQERNEDGSFGEWIYDVYERPEFNPKKDECIRLGQERINRRKLKQKEQNLKKRNKVVESSPKPGNPISNEPKPGNPFSGNPKTGYQDNNNIKDTNIDLTNIDEDEEEKRFADEGNSELVEFLLKNNITEENAITFEKGCLEQGLIDFDKETALKAIEWSLTQFKEGKCYEPYKYAVGRLKRLLDGKLKEVGIKSVVGNKKIKTEKIPDWFYTRNEERNDVENDEKINFEAERQKILAKLYS